MADSQQFRKKFFAGNFILLAIVGLILFAVFLLKDFFGGAKLDWTADKIYTISSKTRDILVKLKDDVTITFYCSEELPGILKTLRRDTKDMFDEFHELSNGRVNYKIVSPEAEASIEAEAKLKAYKKAVADKKTPEEPEPVQSMEDMFRGRQKQTPEQIRANRDKLAATIAAQQKRTKEEVFDEILIEEFRQHYNESLEQKQIRPVAYNVQEASAVKQGRIFSAMEIKYLSKEAEVVPRHFQIESLEYELASRILKLAVPEKPVIAFFDARKPAAPPQNPMQRMPMPTSDYDQIVGALGEQFDVRSIALKENDSIDDLAKRVKEDRLRKELEGKSEAEKKELEPKQDKTVKPEEIKDLVRSFVVAQPDQLEPRQVFEINRAVSLGVPTIFFVSRYTLDISQEGLRQGIPINVLTTGIEDMFRKWGLELGNEMLASNEMGTIDIPQRVFGNIVAPVPTPLALCVQATQETINQESNLTSRIASIVFPATSGLKVLGDVLAKNSLKSEVLATTIPHTWSVKINPFEKPSPFNPQGGMGDRVGNHQKDLVEPKDPQRFQDFVEATPLAVLVTGKFPFVYEGETIPDWKKQESPDAGPGGPGGLPPGIPGLPPGLDGDHALGLNAQDADDKAVAPPPVVAPPLPVEAAPAAPPVPSPPVPNPTGGAAPGTPAEAKPEEKPRASLVTQEGSILVLASVDMMKNDVIATQSRQYQPNINFFYNAVENYGLGNELIEIRRKQLTERRFKPDSDKKAAYIQWLNVAVVPLLVALFGFVYFLVRRSDANAYERRYIQKNQS